MSDSLEALGILIRQESSFVPDLLRAVSRVLVGQTRLVNRMLLGLLTGGHVLIEGVPGLAKTLAVRALATSIDASFQRIQFTPDILPSDVIGTLIYSPSQLDFLPKQGPIFHQIILADEINRAPAKVQSALLECMAEQQVTLGEITYPLPQPFIVLATQNPIEQEGTYPLPEAQLDRFMFKVLIGYPNRDEEREILQRTTGAMAELPAPVIQPEVILNARRFINDIYVSERIMEYVLDLIQATRKPADFGLPKLQTHIQYGASPRASIALIRAAKAQAFLNRRAYVNPDDIKGLVSDVLRHRILLTYEALASDVTVAQIIQHIVKQIPVP